MIFDFKEIDKLTPSDFELFIRDVFISAGWTDAVITEVGKEFRHGDGGVDIFAYKNKRKFAIEVKQRQEGSTVDVKALNQLVTGAKLANVTNMVLVTNSYFTSEVRIRALRLGVELIDRDGLQNLWVERHSEIGREIKPRVYQESVIEESLNLFKVGKTRLLIEMATGLGKTYTVAILVKRILQKQDKNLRVLFLAHQVEILLQSVTAFKNVFGIGTYSFSACFDGSDPEGTDFVFGSFDTLYTKINTLSNNTFDIVIVDEAHHVPARTYSEVVTHFQSQYLIGLTATPFRQDNKDVIAFFGGSEGHIGKYDLAWALRHNKLAFPRYLVLLDDLDESRIEQLEQGLSIQDLDKQLFLHKKDEEVVRIIEKTIQDKKIENPKGIVFCRSISHMKYLLQFFPIGSATLVHSKMLDHQRRQNIRDFRESEYRYILVCDLFNEGIDIPETNILIFMRYTGSQTIWLQQLGRGLRKTVNKEYVYVLDFVGSLERLNEVQRLKRAVEKTPLDKENWEPSPRDRKFENIHDTSLEVSYSQSAAKVLELIEELKYRLNSRSQAIKILRKFYETNGVLPNFELISNLLEEISTDQIATHFESYMGYIEAALPELALPDLFFKQCRTYSTNYYQQHGVKPSNKAVSSESEINNLLRYSEPEVQKLLKGEQVIEDEKHRIEDQYLKDFSGPLNKDDLDSEENTKFSKKESDLLNKHLPLVFSPSDIKGLSSEERTEIKTMFRSEFYLGLS
ncbi:MAG: DEAD/DEAH box helicase [Methylococcaceae bacterium]|nr:DEAD/DEAH box helicase [Methylococcaceae bacterium]